MSLRSSINAFRLGARKHNVNAFQFRHALGLSENDSVEFGQLTLPPGGTTTHTAPFYLSTQPAGLTDVEQGAFELIGNSLQFTQLLKRRGVSLSQSVLTSDVTLANSTTESSNIIAAEHGPQYLEIGKCEEIMLRGVIQQAAAGSGRMQLRVKYAGSTKLTIQTNVGSIPAGTPFEARIATTVRSIGASGTMQINAVVWIDGYSNTPDASTLATIDTTTAQETTVTIQWTVANAGNSVTINQGRVLCIEPNK